MKQNQTLIAILTDAISRLEQASITIAEAKEPDIGVAQGDALRIC
jgi:hypothetical protein